MFVMFVLFTTGGFLCLEQSPTKADIEQETMDTKFLAVITDDTSDASNGVYSMLWFSVTLWQVKLLRSFGHLSLCSKGMQNNI